MSWISSVFACAFYHAFSLCLVFALCYLFALYHALAICLFFALCHELSLCHSFALGHALVLCHIFTFCHAFVCVMKLFCVMHLPVSCIYVLSCLCPRSYCYKFTAKMPGKGSACESPFIFFQFTYMCPDSLSHSSGVSQRKRSGQVLSIQWGFP